MTVLEQDITVGNQRGVHSRVATGLALIAREHRVSLKIIRGTEEIDGTSILDVLGLALVCGSRLTVRIAGEGTRPAAALTAVARILTQQDEA